MLPPALDMVLQLVATPSVSSPDDRFDQSNRGVIDLVAEWAAELGFTVRIDALPGQPGKANLIATLGKGEEAVEAWEEIGVEARLDRSRGDDLVVGKHADFRQRCANQLIQETTNARAHQEHDVDATLGSVPQGIADALDQRRQPSRIDRL